MSEPKLYIRSAAQISMQEPLSQAWMTSPIACNDPLAPTHEANYREFLSPIVMRRMIPIMKRAVATTMIALQEAGIEHPDAIIAGTGLGNMSCTENFLNEIVSNAEQCLKPTYFMQSTHNTVASTLGILTKTHGYNSTYSHGGVSFELALQDAFVQSKLRRITSALVGGYDEMTPHYFRLLQKTGYVGLPQMCPCAEVAVSMVLSIEKDANNLAEIQGVVVAHGVTTERVGEQIRRLLTDASMTLADVDAVLMGVNGNDHNDHIYDEVAKELLPSTPLLRYKHIFGENYTASAFGVYAAAQCLAKGCVPQSMVYKNAAKTALSSRNILLFNHSEGNDFSIILLKKICC